MAAVFENRRDAGRALADRLVRLARLPRFQSLAPGADVVVLALPRGGVPVAHEVARALGAPLDVLVVRKLGVPRSEEFAMGAIASGGAEGPVRILNRATIEALGIDERDVEAVIAREERELARRERAYRGDRPPLAVRGRTVLLVDDGLATGASMLAAVAALRRLAPARIVVAAPVGAAQSCRALRDVADECVCVVETPRLDGVGAWYHDFAQTTDAEVAALLAAPTTRGAPAAAAP